VEKNLGMQTAPITWPIGMGKRFRGTYHLYSKEVQLFDPEAQTGVGRVLTVKGLDDPLLDELLGSQAVELRHDVELLEGAAHPFDLEEYLAGRQTPVFFGSAINTFGVQQLLDTFVQYAPTHGPAPPSPVWYPPTKSSSPALCSRFRQTWTRPTGTGSLFSGSAPDGLSGG